MEISGKTCIKLHATYEHTLQWWRTHVVNTRIGHYVEYVCLFCSYRAVAMKRWVCWREAMVIFMGLLRGNAL